MKFFISNQPLVVIARILLFVFSTALSFKSAQSIAELYFFDTLFYRKSTKFGYNEWVHKDRDVARRLSDFRLLQNSEEKAVLGVSSDQHYTVAVIGDSFVYGTGVKYEERFTTLLERRLSELSPTKIIALGFPGDQMLDHYVKYVRAKTTIHPNVVVVTLVDNDFVINPPGRKQQEDQVHELLKKCTGDILYQDTKGIIDIPWEELVARYNYPASTDRYINSCLFEEIVSRMRSDNVVFFISQPFFALDQPTYYYSGRSESYKQFTKTQQTMETIIKRHGGDIISLSPLTFPYTTVSKKEGHPSKDTHRRYADVLFEKITTGPYGFTKQQEKQ